MSADIGAERRRVRARLAVVTRDNPSSPELAVLRREYAMLKLADAIQTTLEKGPGLDPEQRERLISMLKQPAGART